MTCTTGWPTSSRAATGHRPVAGNSGVHSRVLMDPSRRRRSLAQAG